MSLLKPNLSRDVANLVYTPTTAACFIIAVNHEWVGLALYLFVVLTALSLGLFRQLPNWPTLSKVVLLSGPLFVVSGLLFFRIAVIGVWAIIPGVLFTILGVAGTLALRTANLE